MLTGQVNFAFNELVSRCSALLLAQFAFLPLLSSSTTARYNSYCFTVNALSVIMATDK